MIYRIFHNIYLGWVGFTWKVWRKHRAWDIVRGADFDDPEEIALLHCEAYSRDDLLLSVQLEMLLEEIGVETIILSQDQG